ncbi:unnamed protein product [Auanema sp. JU1783]|nr:unnamed protein product [Auanema sp. JU1783]
MNRTDLDACTLHTIPCLLARNRIRLRSFCHIVSGSLLFFFDEYLQSDFILVLAGIKACVITMVVSTRSSARQGKEEKFVYEPRQKVALRDFVGFRYIDQYLEYDCLMTPDELRRLSAHKYSAVDTSWLDELCMKTFWDKVVELYPMWLAPNLITLIGLIVNLLTVLILTYFCPTATEVAPSWAYLLAALGLFMYQTLDATDGKQSRRTGTSSPLGELFDHGCDSISQVFVTLNVCYALQLGELRNSAWLVCVLSLSLFYCAHWSTYCTGKLKFARFDVTEAQMTVISMLLTTGIFGPGIWKIGLFGLELRHLVIISSLLGTLYQGGGYLYTIMTGGVGKNGSTVAGTSVLFPVCPLMAVVIPFCMIYSKSNSDVFQENFTLFVLFFGAVATKATNRLIVAHMSRSELFIWDWIYLAPIALILNQYYDFVFAEKMLLNYCTIYAYASLLIYCWVITRQICEHMGIRCFTITPIKH